MAAGQAALCTRKLSGKEVLCPGDFLAKKLWLKTSVQEGFLCKPSLVQKARSQRPLSMKVFLAKTSVQEHFPIQAFPWLKGLRIQSPCLHESLSSEKKPLGSKPPSHKNLPI